MQLNLENLPDNLFYERWKKNPSEEKLVDAYLNFSTSSTVSQQQLLSNGNQDYQYMLIRLLQKVQRFVIQNPESAITFYTSLNELFVSEVEKLNQQKLNNSEVIPAVKNPLVTRGKGRPSNKRIIGIGDLTKRTNKKRKNCENTNSNNNIISLDNHESAQTTNTISRPLREIQNLNTIPSTSPSTFTPPPSTPPPPTPPPSTPPPSTPPPSTPPSTSPSTQFPCFFEPDFLSNELDLEGECTYNN